MTSSKRAPRASLTYHVIDTPTGVSVAHYPTVAQAARERDKRDKKQDGLRYRVEPRKMSAESPHA